MLKLFDFYVSSQNKFHNLKQFIYLLINDERSMIKLMQPILLCYNNYPISKMI